MIDLIPKGATHKHEFYGRTYYFKKDTYSHINQVSEELEERADWFSWDGNKWFPETPQTGFSPRLLMKI